VRSGLVETHHEGVVAVSDSRGELIAWSGDVDRPFYLRSSAKPFQGYVSQSSGAGLEPIELAMACASHRGFPVQIALVETMLREGGLDPTALRCPPDWPISSSARDILIRRGEARPRRLWHNCSGKHAGFLRACVAQGWPLDDYLNPDHPLQQSVIKLVSDLGEQRVEPVGVDGCGAPVMRTTARAMALMFAKLGSDPRFEEVFKVMHRYPALIAGTGAGDTTVAIATNGVAKGGAQGCIGVALRQGLGIAVKSWDGLGEIADVAVVATLESLGVLSTTARSALKRVGAPQVYGGGVPVGTTESRLDLVIA
jgi:L-asparaginase II